MASNTIINAGPTELTTTTTTGLLSPPTLTGGTPSSGAFGTNTYLIVRHIRVVNRTSSAATFSLFKDASATATATKSIVGNGLSVAANSAFDWYGMLKLKASETDKFINGGASANSALVINFECEIGIE